jgi:hypothetical protein
VEVRFADTDRETDVNISERGIKNTAYSVLVSISERKQWTVNTGGKSQRVQLSAVGEVYNDNKNTHK